MTKLEQQLTARVAELEGKLKVECEHCPIDEENNKLTARCAELEELADRCLHFAAEPFSVSDNFQQMAVRTLNRQPAASLLMLKAEVLEGLRGKLAGKQVSFIDADGWSDALDEMMFEAASLRKQAGEVG